MTRISLVSVVYCSLETPAMSPAPYAHQWHTKPMILGLNLSPALIRFHLSDAKSGFKNFRIQGPASRQGIRGFPGINSKQAFHLNPWLP
jgi:hypothetical protein